MKKKAPILLAAIIILSLTGCKQVVSENVHSYFLDPPPAAERDVARPLEPTDIVSFMSLEDGSEGPQVPEELLKSHVTVFCPGFYGLNNLAANQNNTLISADKGIRIIKWLSVGDLEGADPSEVPETADAQCEDIDGNLIPFHVGGGKPTQCTNNPIWQQQLIDEAVIAAQCGAVAVCADEWPGTSDSVGYGGCFCDYCMAGFREYLLGSGNEETLQSFGIKDLDSFDYGEFIRQNYYDLYKEVIYHESNDEVPLLDLFRTYQYQSVTEFMRQLKEEIVKTRQEVFFTANMAELMSSYMAVADVVDFFSPELYYAYPVNARTAVRYELGNAFDAPVNAAPNCVENKELMTGSRAAQVMKIYTAEAYAHGGYVQVPYGAPYFSGEYGVNQDRTAVEMETLYPYYDYIYNNKMLFEELWPMADVGVLYSFASIMGGTGGGSEDFSGCTQMLIENNIACRVVATGDGTLIHKQLDDESLEGLKVFVMPSVSVMSQNDTDVITRFMENGGQVVAFNDTALVDENGNSMNTSLTANTGEDILGDRYIHLPQNMHWWEDEKWQMIGPEDAEVDTCLNAVTSRIDYGYNTADKEILGTFYFSNQVNGYVLHLVNYAFDEQKHRVDDKRNVCVEIKNDTPFDSQQLGVFYATPEIGELKEIDFTLEDGNIVVNLPNIDAWGTLVIGEGVRVQTLIKLTKAEVSLHLPGQEPDSDIVAVLAQAREIMEAGEYEAAAAMIDEAVDLPAKKAAALALESAAHEIENIADTVKNAESRELMSEAQTAFDAGEYVQCSQKCLQLIMAYAVRQVDGRLNDYFESDKIAEDPRGDAVGEATGDANGCDLGNVYACVIDDKLYIAVQAESDDPFVQYNISNGQHDWTINCQGDPVEMFYFEDWHQAEVPKGVELAFDEGVELCLPLSMFGGVTEIRLDINAYQNNYPDFTRSDELSEEIRYRLGK